MSEKPELDWLSISRRSGFPLEAFEFVREGLAHTITLVHGEDAARELMPSEDHHVSGRELCLGLRDFAIERYGMLACTVLERWGIRSTHDFGRIVYALIDAQVLRKSDSDSLEDFDGVYDFDEAFAPAETL